MLTDKLAEEGARERVKDEQEVNMEEEATGEGVKAETEPPPPPSPRRKCSIQRPHPRGEKWQTLGHRKGTIIP